LEYLVPYHNFIIKAGVVFVMPVMTRMRDSMPVILIGLVIAFLLTIVFEWGMDYLGLQSKQINHVGAINGRKVTYEEFTELVRQASENQRAQTNNEPDENQMAQIRDQVWNNLVNQTLIEGEMRRMGISVTDQEIYDWVHGSNPPQFLRQQFTDSVGVFDRAAYDNAIQNPQNREVWVTVERVLRQQRSQEKLQGLLFASVRATEPEIFQRFADQNLKVNAEYILFDPNRLVKDEDVEVSEADIKKFYKEKAEDYKVEETRKLKYVLFSDTPSAQDTQVVLADLEDIRKQVEQGADFVETANLYGQVQNTGAFFKHGELSQAKEGAIFNAKVGDVVGPIQDFDGYHLIKILEERQGQDEFIRASHILISIKDNDSVAARNKAREVFSAAQKGERFDELALQHSQDPGSAKRGGDLGWFGKGRMVKEFEEAAFKAKPGQIVGPVKSQFGYHIIKVVDKSKKELKIADIGLPVKASSQTRSNVQQNALDFAYVAKNEGFTQAAEQLGFNVIETPTFTKNAAIPGLGVHQSLSKFAFDGKVGSISDMVSVTNGVVVCMVSEVQPAGVRPLEEVRDAIKSRVLREKKMERVKKMAEEFRNAVQPSDSLGAVVLGHPELHAQRTGQFSPAGFVPGIGRDLTFVGAASALEVNAVSKPVESTRGVYLIKLIERVSVDSAAYQAQRANLMTQLTQEKRNRFVSEWLEYLKKNADIEDNRDLLFR
jgi:peptidyl-prolyl cis-trans isomerase D